MKPGIFYNGIDGFSIRVAAKDQDTGELTDVLIYDPAALYFDMERYDIVHDMPGGDWRRKGRAGGYDAILVNGVVTHRGGKPTGATPGRLLRVCGDRGTELAEAAE